MSKEIQTTNTCEYCQCKTCKNLNCPCPCKATIPCDAPVNKCPDFK